MNGAGTREVWKVDAFASAPFAGNPAGVVPRADGLAEEMLLPLARELNDISETVFVFEGEKAGGTPNTHGTSGAGLGADFRFRYFTSSCEVDLCGHATIAALFTLAWTGRIRSVEGSLVLHIATRVGIIQTKLSFQNGEPQWASMEQLEPKYMDAPQGHLAATILGIEQDALDPTLPVACASSGLWACFVPLRSWSDLARLRVDRPRIEELWPANPDLTGVYPFAFEDEGTTRGRFFVPPKFGIVEDPVTGTACGALGAYLLANKRMPAGGTLLARQGIEMGRGGAVRVECSPTGRMRIGGQAAAVFRGNLFDV